MSKAEPERQRDALRRKLRDLVKRPDLVDCVMAKADDDTAFADQLAQILLSETASERAPRRVTRPKPKQTFNPVQFLKDHGEAALDRELEGRTDDDLRNILRYHGLRRGKDVKKLERAEMLRVIANGSRTKLKQGMVVGLRAQPGCATLHNLTQTPAFQAQQRRAPRQ